MKEPSIPVKAPGALGEFQKFLTKSNAIALAIGVIVGAATGQVVTALVEDFFNPIIGALLANVDLKSAQIVLGTVKGPDGNMMVNAIKYGDFISVLINFAIIMAVVFVVAKAVARDVLK